MKTYFLIKIITDEGHLVDACDVVNSKFIYNEYNLNYDRYDTKDLALLDLDAWISNNEYHNFEFTILECYK